MKIHDKDPSTIVASNPTSPMKRRRPSAKRKPSLEDEGDLAEEPPAKKVRRGLRPSPRPRRPPLEEVTNAGLPVLQASDDSPRDRRSAVQGEEELHCPICFKTFICKYGLESHMETHPDASLRYGTSHKHAYARAYRRALATCPLASQNAHVGRIIHSHACNHGFKQSVIGLYQGTRPPAFQKFLRFYLSIVPSFPPRAESPSEQWTKTLSALPSTTKEEACI